MEFTLKLTHKSQAGILYYSTEETVDACSCYIHALKKACDQDNSPCRLDAQELKTHSIDIMDHQRQRKPKARVWVRVASLMERKEIILLRISSGRVLRQTSSLQ